MHIFKDFAATGKLSPSLQLPFPVTQHRKGPVLLPPTAFKGPGILGVWALGQHCSLTQPVRPSFRMFTLPSDLQAMLPVSCSDLAATHHLSHLPSSGPLPFFPEMGHLLPSADISRLQLPGRLPLGSTLSLNSLKHSYHQPNKNLTAGLGRTKADLKPEVAAAKVHSLGFSTGVT